MRSAFGRRDPGLRSWVHVRRTDGIAHARTGTFTDTGGGCVDVPGRPEDGHAVGQGWQVERNPHAGGAPAVPRVGGSGVAAGADPAAAAGRLTPGSLHPRSSGPQPERQLTYGKRRYRLSPAGA